MRLPGRVGDLCGNCRSARMPRYHVARALIALLLGFLPAVTPVTVFATSNIARAVETFCAPQPTLPPVSSCSTCHASTKNRGANDLTVNGQWAVSSATYSLFCPDLNQDNQSSNNSGDSVDSGSSSPEVRPRSSGIGGMSGGNRSSGIGMGRGAIFDEGDMLTVPGTRSGASSGFSLSATLRRLLRLSIAP